MRNAIETLIKSMRALAQVMKSKSISLKSFRNAVIGRDGTKGRPFRLKDIARKIHK